MNRAKSGDNVDNLGQRRRNYQSYRNNIQRSSRLRSRAQKQVTCFCDKKQVTYLCHVMKIPDLVTSSGM